MEINFGDKKLKKIINTFQNVQENRSNIIPLILPVLYSINSILNKLKLYQCIPINGLVINYGTYRDDDGKERDIIIEFEPLKVNKLLYLQRSQVVTLLENDIYGFIVADRKNSLHIKIIIDLH